MSKKTYQPKRKKAKRKLGFMKRMSTRGVGAEQGPKDRKHSLRQERGEVSADNHHGKPLGTTILG
jgi:hypothetical protein